MELGGARWSSVELGGARWRSHLRLLVVAIYEGVDVTKLAHHVGGDGTLADEEALTDGQWTGVDGRGRAWTGVDGRGQVWKVGRWGETVRGW